MRNERNPEQIIIMRWMLGCVVLAALRDYLCRQTMRGLDTCVGPDVHAGSRTCPAACPLDGVNVPRQARYPLRLRMSQLSFIP